MSKFNVKNVIDDIVDDPYNFAKNTSITRLVDILKQLSTHYYNTGKALVSDEIYDILKEVLVEREPQNKFLKEVGAPISKDKVKLPYTMASLDKIKPSTDAIVGWKNKYAGPYVLSDKLDGVSGLLVKEDSDTYKLYTRGDGEYGQDISYLIKHVVNADLDKLPDGVAIRGELIVSKKNFKRVKDDFKNARNAVAGLVNAKHYSTKLAKLTDFVGYAVLNPNLKQYDQMKHLEKWKFPMVNYKVSVAIDNDMLSNELIKRRDGGKYEIDGIVVIDSSKKYKLPEKNPPYGFAFKTVLTDQVVETIVMDVEWSASKDGYLKPRIRVTPVDVVGVTITYATAHNAKYVVDNNLGPGAVVKLVRSGDVIPYIMDVLKPSATGKPKMPDIPYKWNKTGIDLLVKDIYGSAKDAIVSKQLVYFFKTMGVKYISEGIIKKLVDNGYNNLFKILDADIDDISKIEGVGEKLWVKISANTNTAFKNTTLEQLMAASNTFGRGFGKRRLKVIVNAYPDILKWNVTKQQMTNKIKELDGFDDITASQFAEGIDDFKKFFSKLEKYADLSHLKKKRVVKVVKGAQPFKDMKIVFTGFRDADLEKTIIGGGGSVTTTVSKNTSVVIYADKGGSKYKKAVELGTKLMTKDEFKKKFNV